MKNAKFILGLISVLALPFAARAQTTMSSTDLLMGFRASGGTGATLNLQVDLGSITSFLSGANSTAGVHTIGNLAVADLVSTYGSSWNTRSDLTWGILGANGGVNKSLYGTFAESTPGTVFPSGSIDISSQSLRNTPINLVQGQLTALNGQTAASNNFSTVLSTGDTASWSSVGFADAGVAYSFFDLTTFENNTNITGGSYVVSDLYRYTSSDTLAYVGSFALNTAGTLFFSTSASSFATPVPEPSTYAAIAGVLALGVVAVRRRQNKVAAV